jgi:hypothetical protein
VRLGVAALDLFFPLNCDEVAPPWMALDLECGEVSPLWVFVCSGLAVHEKKIQAALPRRTPKDPKHRALAALPRKPIRSGDTSPGFKKARLELDGWKPQQR